MGRGGSCRARAPAAAPARRVVPGHWDWSELTSTVISSGLITPLYPKGINEVFIPEHTSAREWPVVFKHKPYRQLACTIKQDISND